MATHSSILAWRIPWTEEPGRLQSIGSKSRTQLKRLSMSACTHIYIIYTLDSNLHLSYCYILSTHGRGWNLVGNFFPTPWVSMRRSLQWTHTSASCPIHWSTFLNRMEIIYEKNLNTQVSFFFLPSLPQGMYSSNSG